MFCDILLSVEQHLNRAVHHALWLSYYIVDFSPPTQAVVKKYTAGSVPSSQAVLLCRLEK
jgi:hypothetical protein